MANPERWVHDIFTETCHKEVQAEGINKEFGFRLVVVEMTLRWVQQ